MTRQQAAILCAIALAWGCTYLFIKVILNGGIEPLGIAAARTALGAATLIPFAWRARNGFRQPRSTWLALLFLGLINFAVPWTIFAIAGEHVPSGASAVANASAPFWSAILATIFLKAERLSPLRISGLVLGFAGVLVLMGGGLSALSGGEAGSILLILVATLCYSASAVSIRKWLTHVPAVPLATAQVTVAALTLTPLALLTGAFAEAEMNFRVLASIGALGAFGSGLAVVGYMYLIQNVGPVRASVVTYMLPPIGVFLGWLYLDEAIGWNLAAALALILSGVALVQGIGISRIRNRRGARLMAAPWE